MCSREHRGSLEEASQQAGPLTTFLQLQVRADSIKDLEPEGLRFHENVRQGRYLFPCSTTSASKGAEMPQKRMKTKVGTASRNRWLQDQGQFTPWFYDEQNMFTDGSGKFCAVPIETKAALHP